VDDVGDAITDALLHHAAELVLAGAKPLDVMQEAIFGVGFVQGARWAQTGDWRLEDD
jgi:hypothetical protein